MSRFRWIALACLVVSAPAEADIDRLRLKLSDALMDDDRDGVVALMADPFTTSGLFFTDEACAKLNKPGKLVGKQRRELLDCFAKQGQLELMLERSPNTIWLDIRKRPMQDVVAYEVVRKGNKLLSIGSAAAVGKEQAVPTVMYRNENMASTPLELTAATRAAIKKLPERETATMRMPNGAVENQHKICFDAKGTVTSRRLIMSSELKAYDDETTKAVAAMKSVKPFELDGKPVAACEIVKFSHDEAAR